MKSSGNIFFNNFSVTEEEKNNKSVNCKGARDVMSGRARVEIKTISIFYYEIVIKID